MYTYIHPCCSTESMSCFVVIVFGFVCVYVWGFYFFVLQKTFTDHTFDSFLLNSFLLNTVPLRKPLVGWPRKSWSGLIFMKATRHWYLLFVFPVHFDIRYKIRRVNGKWIMIWDTRSSKSTRFILISSCEYAFERFARICVSRKNRTEPSFTVVCAVLFF